MKLLKGLKNYFNNVICFMLIITNAIVICKPMTIAFFFSLFHYFQINVMSNSK